MDNPNQASQAQQPTNPTPAPVSNPSKSKMIPIIFGVVVIILISIGAYALGTKQAEAPALYPAQITSSPSPTTIDETANWKTYKNEALKFEFQYPEFFLTYFEDNSDDLEPPYLLNISLYHFGEGTGELTNVIVFITTETSNLELDDYYASEQKNDYTLNAQKEEIIVRGNNGYKSITEQRTKDSKTGEVFTQTIYTGIIKKNTQIYSLSLSGYKKYHTIDIEKLFDQILSTFRFSN